MILCCSCDEWPEYDWLTVNNKSQDTLLIFFSVNYPDTLYPEEWFHWGLIPPDTVLSVRSYDERDYPFSYNSIVQLFIYNKTIFDQIPWESRRLARPLRRYEVTRPWMDEHGWTITYP